MGKRLLCAFLSAVLIASNLELSVFAVQSEDPVINETMTEEISLEDGTEESEEISSEQQSTQETGDDTKDRQEETATEEKVSSEETAETERDSEYAAEETETAENETVTTETVETASEETASEETASEETASEETETEVTLEDKETGTLPSHTVEEVKDIIIERMELAIETYQESFYLGDLAIPASEEENLAKLYHDYMIEAPQYFWLKDNPGCLSIIEEENEEIKSMLLYVFADGIEWHQNGEFKIAKIKNARIELQQVLESIVAPIDSDMSDLDKAYCLYQYMIRNVKYDDTLSKFTAYDALVGGEAVCQGYMMAYTLLLNYVGIPVKNVVSFGLNHGWNMIQIDGSWYYVDCTWGSAYNTFMMSETELREVQQISAGHTYYDWDLYTGRTITASEGDPDLPASGSTSGYREYLFKTNKNSVYVDGFWYYIKSEYVEEILNYQKSIYRASLDKTVDEKLDEAQFICLYPFMNQVYYAHNSSDTTTVYCYDTVPGNTSVVATYPLTTSEVAMTYKNGKLILDLATKTETLSIDRMPVAIHAKPPVKQCYEVGDEFNPTGMSVYLISSDAKAQWQEDYTVSGFSSDSTGRKEIQVSCQDKSTSFSVQVTDSSEEQGIHVARQSYLFDEIGATATIKAVLRGDGENAGFTYESNDESIASVDDNGRIVAKKQGATGIMVTSGIYRQMVYVAVDTTKYSGGGETEQDLTPVYDYNDTDHTAKLIGCTGDGTVLNIPQMVTLAGTSYTVTEIGAFMTGVSQIESVSIPDTVTKIGSYAFNGSVGSRAKLRNVELPQNCELAEHAFSHTSIEHLNIPNGITLGAYAFSGCTSLNSVSIDTGTVSDDCFEDCSKLTTIDWGTNVRTIGSRAFAGCDLTSVAIPEGVTTVKSYAFYENANLSEATIPSTTTSLGYGIFDKVASALTIHLYCTVIQQVESGSITDVTDAKYIFHGKFSSAQIALFGEGIHYEVVDGEDPNPDGPPEDASLFEEDRVWLKAGEKYRIRTNYYDIRELTLTSAFPDIVSVDEQGMASTLQTGVCAVSAYNADGEYLDSVVFTVYDMGFDNEAVHMQLGETRTLVVNQTPDIISSFDRADYQIDGGKTVEIVSKETEYTSVSPDNVQGYYGLITVKAVNIGASALTVSDAQSGASASCRIIVDENGSNQLQDDTFTYVELSEGELAITGPVVTQKTDDGRDIWFDRGSTYFITDGLFGKLTIPSEVTINKKKYRVTQVSADAFKMAGDSAQIGIAPDEIVVEEGIKKIGNCAFYSFSGTNVSLPNSLRSLGGGAFAQTQLKEIELPANLETMGDGCFHDSTIEKVIFLGGPSRLPAGTFLGCTKLSRVSLAENMTGIERDAFSGCTSLKVVSLPDGLRRIEWRAFSGCSALESLIIPKGVTYLSSDSFVGCSALKKIMLFCTNIERLAYEYIFPDADAEFYVSRENDNTQMLEHLFIREYKYLEDLEFGELSIQGKNSMCIGGTQQLAVMSQSGQDLTDQVMSWTSSAPGVAIVSGGFVKALAEGSSEISAVLCNGEKQTFTIRVFQEDMETLAEQSFGEGIVAITNLQKTLADIRLPQGWAFENTGEVLTASDKVQYFAGTYTQDGYARACEIPVSTVEISGVRIAGAPSMTVGETMIYQAVPEGIGALDRLRPDLEWSYADTEYADLSTASNCVTAVAKKAGNVKINVRLKLSDDQSFTSSLSLTVLSANTGAEKDFGYWDEPDFSVYYQEDGSVGTSDNYMYLLKYGIISQEDRTLAVMGFGQVGTGKAIIPDTVTYDSKTYQVVELAETLADSYTKNQQQLTLPATLKRIHPLALSGYEMLSKITVEEGNTAFTVGEDGALYNADKTYLHFVPVKNNGTFELPASVTDFNPTQVGKITGIAGESTLKGNFSDGIYTPDGKKMIYAPLPKEDVIEIPYGVEEIGALSMYYRPFGTKIVIPRTVYKLDEYALAVKRLQVVTAKEIVFEEGSCITQIPRFAFYGMDISSITLPSTVREIGTRAFSGNLIDGLNLAGLNELTYIGECAFNAEGSEQCVAGYCFVLPASVEYVGAEAFGYSYTQSTPYVIYYKGTTPPVFGKLKESRSHYIEHRVPEAAVSAYTAALEAAGRDIVSEQVKGYQEGTEIEQRPLVSQEGIKYTLDTKEHTAKVAVVSALDDGVLSIPASIVQDGTTYTVTEIGSRVVSSGNSGKLIILEIPSSVEKISDSAFSGCSKLCRVAIRGNGLKEIGANAFQYCVSLRIVALPDSLTIVDATAFDDTSTDLVIVTGEGTQAATALKGTNTIKLIGTDVFVSDHVYWTKNGTNASIYYADDADEIPASVQEGTQTYIVDEIGDMAYAGSMADTLTIPEGIETIGANAFANSRVPELKFAVGSRLKAIKKGAFYQSRFRNIIIPETVTSLEYGLCYGATNLEQVIFKGKVPEITKGTASSPTLFGKCSSLKKLMVPKDQLDAYQQALEGQYPDSEVEFVAYSVNNNLPMTGMSVSDETLMLDVGESKTVSVSVQPENTTDSTAVVWKSSDISVARVRSGVITALSEGTAVVTATIGDFSKEIQVTVNQVQKGEVSFAAPVLSGALTEQNRVYLTWQAIEGADGYALYRSQSRDSGFVRQKAAISGTRTGYIDTLAVNGNTYYYKLAAYKKYSDGTYQIGALSNVVEVVVEYTEVPSDSKYERIGAVVAADSSNNIQVEDSFEKLKDYLTVTVYAKDGTSKVIEDYTVAFGTFVLGDNTVEITWLDKEADNYFFKTSVPVFVSSESKDYDYLQVKWNTQGRPEGEIGQPYESIRYRLKVSVYDWGTGSYRQIQDFTIQEGTFAEGTNIIVISYQDSYYECLYECRVAAVGVSEAVFDISAIYCAPGAALCDMIYASGIPAGLVVTKDMLIVKAYGYNGALEYREIELKDYTIQNPDLQKGTNILTISYIHRDGKEYTCTQQLEAYAKATELKVNIKEGEQFREGNYPRQEQFEVACVYIGENQYCIEEKIENFSVWTTEPFKAGENKIEFSYTAYDSLGGIVTLTKTLTVTIGAVGEIEEDCPSLSDSVLTVDKYKDPAYVDFYVYPARNTSLNAGEAGTQSQKLYQTNDGSDTVQEGITYTVDGQNGCALAVAASVKKGTYSLYLKVYVNETKHTYYLPLVITVTEKIPKLTAMTTAINLYDVENGLTSNVTLKNIGTCTIASAELGSTTKMADYFTVSVDEKQQSVTLRLKDNTVPKKQIVSKGTLLLKLTEYAKVIEVPVKVSVMEKKPKLRITPANVVLNTYLMPDQRTVSVFVEQNKVSGYEVLDLVESELSITSNQELLESWTIQGSRILLTMKNPSDFEKQKTIKMQLKTKGWPTAQTISCKVKVESTLPKAALQSKTLTLDRRAEGAQTSTYLTFNAMPGEMFYQLPAELTARKNSEKAPKVILQKIDAVTYKVTASHSGSAMTAGTYQYDFTPVLSDATQLKKVTLTVKVTDSKKPVSASFKAQKGSSIDLSRRLDTAYTWKVTANAVNTQIADVTLKKIMLGDKAVNLSSFLLTKQTDDTGTVSGVTLAASFNADLTAGKSYKLYFEVTPKTAGQTLAPSEVCVTVKPKESTPKFTVNRKSAVINMVSNTSVRYLIRPAQDGVTIAESTNVSTNIPEGAFLVTENAKGDYTIRLINSTKVKKNKTYTFKFKVRVEGGTRTVTQSISIKVK